MSNIRVASYNASLNRNSEGGLIADLGVVDAEGRGQDAQAQSVAEIIQRTDPDVLLINEFDFDADGQAAALFQQNYLAVSQNGQNPVDYPYVYVAPSNTGVPSGFDLDNSGAAGDFAPGDAQGFGFFEGQFAFAIFSKHPIVEDEIRTFQNFLWKDMPGALLPVDPEDRDGNGDTANWYTEEELEGLRLSSKNHVDLPIEVDGEIVHILAAHPTPPVFDGPEDRNGTRNHDEIRFWADYVDANASGYIYDDAGGVGGLGANERFVIVGDYNADPFDGDSVNGAAQQIIDSPFVNGSTTNPDVTPSSAGGVAAAEGQAGANEDHIGDPAFDTADFGFAGVGNPDNAPGNLRVDYALPSQSGLELLDQGVFWQAPGEAPFPLAEFPTSDHRLVYVDVAIVPTEATIGSIEFLGEATFPTGFTFDETIVGGLSGLVFDEDAGAYIAISDDRGAPSRVYELTIDVSDQTFEDGDVAFTGVTELFDEGGAPLSDQVPDLEGIALLPDGSLAIANERLGSELTPGVLTFDRETGVQLGAFDVPARYDNIDGTSGVRLNLAFESLTTTPNGAFLFTATENALIQDGPAATPESGSPARIAQYDLETGEIVAEFIYETEPAVEDQLGIFTTNGLVELLSIDTDGTLLALERSFAVSEGNGVKLYEIRTQDAENALGETADAVTPVEKRLVLDLADLGLTLDNLEALAFGPTLSDGRQSLIVASDNNFNDTQVTQFLAFAVDLDDQSLESVASGDVTTTSAVLWADFDETRVDAGPAEVVFELSTDPDFETIVKTVAAETTDPLVPVKVGVDGLQAGETYYYRATSSEGGRLTGRFNTAAEDGYNGLRFGVTGDWRGELAPYPAVSNAAEAELDFMLLGGDTIYADFPSPALPQQQAVTVDEFRIKYDEVYGERGGENFWADVRASTAVFATIDDHEVTNDFAGGGVIGETAEDEFRTLFPGDDPEALVNDSTLYDNGLQAFQEYHPIADAFYGDTGDERTSGERKLYRSQEYGEDAAVIMLDQRSFRDEQIDSAIGAVDPAVIQQFNVESFDPTRTMLGEAQLADLKADLLSAQENGVTWKFIYSPEPFQELGFGNSDSWEGYKAERTEILKFVTENDIENVVFVAADIHATFVNNLTYAEDAAGELSGQQIATSAFEITTGSVAFDQPFGPSIVEGAAALGVLTPEEFAFYNSLPVAPDNDGLPNDRDDFITGVFNATTLAPFGRDPLGLDNNLPQAEGLIDATLLQGGWVSAHTYGWTEFDIDADTQVLTVTTYGVDAYTEEDVAANPEAIAALEPFIVSQFEVNPQAASVVATGEPFQNNVIEGGVGDDTLTGGRLRDTVDGGAGDDIINTGTGRDNILGGAGDDVIDAGASPDVVDAGAGDDIVFGGTGSDTIFGGDGDDEIFGGRANDFLFGGAGDDTIVGGAGARDEIDGGEGDDTLSGGGAPNNVFIFKGDFGDDTVLDFGAGRLDELDIDAAREDIAVVAEADGVLLEVNGADAFGTIKLFGVDESEIDSIL